MDPITAHVAALESKVTLSNAARMLSQTQAPQGASFSDAIQRALRSVDTSQTQATELARDFQLGSPQVSLEDTVIAAQKASLSLQAAVQFRNRVVQAYTDIMNMNV